MNILLIITRLVMLLIIAPIWLLWWVFFDSKNFYDFITRQHTTDMDGLGWFIIVIGIGVIITCGWVCWHKFNSLHTQNNYPT